MNRFKFQLSKFDIGMLIAFAVVGILGGTAWWFLSGQLQAAQAQCAQVAGDYNTYATAKGSGIIVSQANAGALGPPLSALPGVLLELIFQRRLGDGSSIVGDGRGRDYGDDLQYLLLGEAGGEERI